MCPESVPVCILIWNYTVHLFLGFIDLSSLKYMHILMNLIDLPCAQCRQGSACTCVQFDLGLHCSLRSCFYWHVAGYWHSLMSSLPYIVPIVVSEQPVPCAVWSGTTLFTHCSHVSSCFCLVSSFKISAYPDEFNKLPCAQFRHGPDQCAALIWDYTVHMFRGSIDRCSVICIFDEFLLYISGAECRHESASTRC